MLHGTFYCDREGCDATVTAREHDVRDEALEGGWLLVTTVREGGYEEEVVELAFCDQFCLIAYFS